MKAWIGKSFIIIGIIHTAFGLVVCHTILGQLVREGLFNTISGQYDRESAFWFLFSGFAIIIIGALVNWCEHMGRYLPSFLGWSFLAITVSGVVIMPLSGFWLLFVPTAGILLRGRKQQKSTEFDSA